jgi:hypothetical protein
MFHILYNDKEGVRSRIGLYFVRDGENAWLRVTLDGVLDGPIYALMISVQ